MKIITTHFGMVAGRVSNDDVAPPQGLLAREMIEFVGARYNFGVKPIVPPQTAAQSIPHLAFQGGTFEGGNQKVPILALALVVNGDVVVAANTDLATAILDDLVGNLEALFGFRYSQATPERFYQSSLTVQFEKPLESISGLSKMESIINRGIARPDKAFKIKRLAFGSGDPVATELQSQPTIEAVMNGDFTLERRAGAPYEENKFFSLAPLQTADHIKLLEKLEQELS